MTKTRYLLVLASAVLFTLALGIALGGGPLRTPVSSAIESTHDVRDGADNSADLARRNVALKRLLEFEGGFADAVSTRLLADRLTGRGVVILALPGVPTTETESVADDVAAAGGTVTTSLEVGEDLVDPTSRALVDELTRRLVPELGEPEVSQDTPVYTRAGAVLSRALLTTKDAGVAMDDSARSVLNTFTTADLVNGAEPKQRASLAIVLVPEAGKRTATTAARGTILTEVVTAMDQAGDGVAVAGPPTSADERGLVAAVRAAPTAAAEVSTVDSATTRAGQVVTVLALSEQAGGTTGHYGIARSADAVMPTQPAGVSD